MARTPRDTTPADAPGPEEPTPADERDTTLSPEAPGAPDENDSRPSDDDVSGDDVSDDRSEDAETIDEADGDETTVDDDDTTVVPGPAVPGSEEPGDVSPPAHPDEELADEELVLVESETGSGAAEEGDEDDSAEESDAKSDAVDDARAAARTGDPDVPDDRLADVGGPQEPSAGSGETRTVGLPVGRHGASAGPAPGGLRGLGQAMRPRASRSQVVVGVLCALLGFALVAQVSQTQEDQLSSLRQSDLVRLLDDVTQRSGELEDQVSSLESTRDELQSGTGRERAALEVAEQQAETLGILSGRLAAQGPGVEIEVVEGDEPLEAFALFNVLEELRNAGAEAMEVNGVRLVASSYFEDSEGGIVVDGQPITSPYRWTVVGDPSTLETALEIPGGAMASLRSDGARTTIQQADVVEVTATVEPGTPQFATPVPADD